MCERIKAEFKIQYLRPNSLIWGDQHRVSYISCYQKSSKRSHVYLFSNENKALSVFFVYSSLCTAHLFHSPLTKSGGHMEAPYNTRNICCSSSGSCYCTTLLFCWSSVTRVAPSVEVRVVISRKACRHNKTAAYSCPWLINWRGARSLNTHGQETFTFIVKGRNQVYAD